MTVTAQKKPLTSDIPPLFFGNKPTDGGNFLMTRDERDELLRIEPQAERWIRRILGADEFLNAKERWCLWLLDASEDELLAMPAVMKRISAIRQLRLKAGHPAALKMAEKPHVFMQVSQPTSGDYILVPRVSSERRPYIPMGFLKVHRGFPGKAALIFRKKYSESLNPYAIRFITLILLFTPSSTLVCIG